MRDRVIPLLSVAVLAAIACTRVPAGEGASDGGPTSKHGLSAESRAAAGQLRQFIGEKLVQAPDETTHEAHIGEARRQLSQLRSKNKTDSDRKVTLLLAILMAKDNERKRLVFQTRNGLDYASAQEDISSLYEARERCNTEVLGWLEVIPTERSVLDDGPCLAEAQQADALLEQ